MQPMIDFSTWFLGEIPDFLLSEPISYVVGIGLGAFIISLIKKLWEVF